MDPDQQQNIHIIVIYGGFDYYKQSQTMKGIYFLLKAPEHLFNASKSYAHVERWL